MHCSQCGRPQQPAESFVAGICATCMMARAEEVKQRRTAIVEPEPQIERDTQFYELCRWLLKKKQYQVKELERVYALEVRV